MIYLKCNTNRMLAVVVGCVILWVASAFTNAVDKKVRKRQKSGRFVLSSTVVEEKFGLVTQQLRGEISWALDEKDFILHLQIKEISREFQDPNAEAAALKNQPFRGTVLVQRDQEVPLTIEISEGRLESDPLGLSTQYRTAYLIVDMMLATAIKKEFMVSKADGQTTLNVKYPGRAKTGGFGVGDARGLRSSVSPNKFLVFPRMAGKEAKGSDAVYFSHTEATVDYYYRFLDKKSGIATHAVNLEGTLKEKKGKADYEKVLELIDDPKQFESYTLHELTITNVE